MESIPIVLKRNGISQEPQQVVVGVFAIVRLSPLNGNSANSCNW